MLRKLARLFLVLALLAAWQGALEHPLVHLHETLHAHGDDGDSSHDHPHEGPQHEGPHSCDTCVAGAALWFAVHAYVPPVPATSGASMVDSGTRGEFLPRAPPAFRSQAPPFQS